MKFLKLDKGRYHFQTREEERDALLHLIGRYPLIPATYHGTSIGKSGGELNETHKLLEETLEEQRKAVRQQVEAILKSPDRFKAEGKAMRFSLTGEEIQTLLQALNDVRVGSWLILGQPDELTEQALKVTEENVAFLWAMEACGHFQMQLLRALETDGEG